ncbi:MAG: hypothetical protein HGA44_02755 [Cellulomonadaceae bacterium]|nr:hypothetical protein [Cellulomonadaceae bacterium]
MTIAPFSEPDEHWAPDTIVLAHQMLARTATLVLERDEDGEVVLDTPPDEPAVARTRAPWARGPFGRIATDAPVPRAAGLFALVESGTVRYVGTAERLDRMFGRPGIGEITCKDCADPRNDEVCRLNRRVTAEARLGRAIDLYVLVTDSATAAGSRTSRVLKALMGRRDGARHDTRELEAQLKEATGGAWQLA